MYSLPLLLLLWKQRSLRERQAVISELPVNRP
jgi:hypothetical protein